MKDFTKIKNPDFLKKLNNKELQALASDMRSFIIENVSKTGGHLSANLGVVELTIALLKVFDAKKDKILFDVGHQCYPYKILTGRASKFNTLRKMEGISGFQDINESKYDVFEAGHSSTSISTALGMSLARDINKDNYEVISIIGDGSIGNGLAYEALNQIGDLKSKQIIIINDNQMSISENVGAIHNALDNLRSAKGYRNIKEGTKKVLLKTFIGRFIFKILDKIKRTLKRFYLRKGKIFSDFDIEYFGPINGHDFNELVTYFKIAKNENKPVILHVITQKGKGYKPAEEDSIGVYHGLGSFNIETGKVIKSEKPSYSKIMSDSLYEYAKKDKDIIAITPGMCFGSNLYNFKDNLNSQYIDVGIAEEHALLVANGLALSGKKPYVFIYSTFLQRGYDEIIHDIGRMNSNVTLLIDRAGLVPSDGASHQGLLDIAMLSNIPNIVITSPRSANEANNLIYTSLNHNGPFAIRFPKITLDYSAHNKEELEIGKWNTLRKGNDLVIITYGDLVDKALSIADKLSSKLDIMVINALFIIPYDESLLDYLIKLNKPIIVYEEALSSSSLGIMVQNYLYENNFKNKVYIKGIDNMYLTHASRDELLKICKLDENSMINFINKKIK